MREFFGSQVPVFNSEEEQWIERALLWWGEMATEEGLDTTTAHARRVVGGERAGHWCECSPEQREAAKRFLSGVLNA